MTDLIRREDALDALKKYEELESNNFTDTNPISMLAVATIANCIEEIVNLPSAEPERTAKVVEREMIITDQDGCSYHRTEYLCGACEKKVLSGDDYCHHCGAKLDWSE